MSHFLTEEQELLRNTARQFARREVEPLAAQIDRDEHTPPELTRKVAELGFFGLFIPEAYGGSDLGATSTCLVLEEIAKASPSFAGLLSVQIILCPGVVNLIGTEAQKQRVLTKSASGERLMAYSQSEPSGVGNLAKHLTKLTPEGEHYRLNGAKLFCTQGEAKTYIIMCRTFDADGAEGYGCVLAEQEAEGFHVAPYEDKLGWRGTNTGPISFDNVLITPDNVLGVLMSGRADHGEINQVSFMGHAATSLGCVEGLFDKTVEYVNQRELYGAPMSTLQPMSYWLADAAIKIEAMRALLYDATRLWDEGRRDRPWGSMCKAYIGDTAFQCCSNLLQMWGGSGIMTAGVNRYFRDARAKMVAEGASEMHTSIVSSLITGLNPSAMA